MKTIDLNDSMMNSEECRVMEGAQFPFQGRLVKLALGRYSSGRLKIEVRETGLAADGKPLPETNVVISHKLSYIAELTHDDPSLECEIEDGDIAVLRWHLDQDLVQATLESGLFVPRGWRVRVAQHYAEKWTPVPPTLEHRLVRHLERAGIFGLDEGELAGELHEEERRDEVSRIVERLLDTGTLERDDDYRVRLSLKEWSQRLAHKRAEDIYNMLNGKCE